MSRLIKFTALGIAALGAAMVAAPDANAFGRHGGHGGGFGRHGGFGGLHRHGGFGFHRHHHHHFGFRHRHHYHGGWGYGRRLYVYGAPCVWKRYVNYYGEIVVRRICY